MLDTMLHVCTIKMDDFIGSKNPATVLALITTKFTEIVMCSMKLTAMQILSSWRRITTYVVLLGIIVYIFEFWGDVNDLDKIHLATEITACNHLAGYDV
mmetsp:Transcript_7656/g.11796  ORF Transcript_7656/g.11796 Transcript_7656/m.11796 type:complete len:99 (-) Transcript_7656:1639-1935(-)